VFGVGGNKNPGGKTYINVCVVGGGGGGGGTSRMARGSRQYIEGVSGVLQGYLMGSESHQSTLQYDLR